MHDWDDAYANMAHVPGSETLPAYWAESSEAFRKAHRVERMPYGAAPREVYDLILPVTQSKGLMVFIHGGYWMATSPTDWTYLAEGGVAQGWAVALPGYTLAPEASITEIAAQVARAVEDVATRVSGPILLAGHSAGGHLAARLVSEASPLQKGVKARIRHVMPISGVFDLRPLMWTKMNDTLKLSEAEARSQSPALLRPKTSAPVTLWVGAKERPEFLRQSRVMAMMWAGLGAEITLVEDAGHDHFSVIEGLKTPNSAILDRLVSTNSCAK